MPKHSKHKQGHERTNLIESRKRDLLIYAKRQRISFLETLEQEWESIHVAGDHKDKNLHTYILDIRRKIREARNQLVAMRGDAT
jgi:hypothetical protein